MRESYDFSKSVKNPYAKRFKKQITIRIDEDSISYFKEMADEKGIPYQSLINLYLRDCANEHRRLRTSWMSVTFVASSDSRGPFTLLKTYSL